jgi:uncharacterized protein YegP (UPF0339 family)
LGRLHSASRLASINDRSAGATLPETDIDHFIEEDTNMAKFELYKSSNGEYRWRLKASNGQVIAPGGEGYSSRAAAQGGIDAVKRVAATAPVEDA